MVRFSPDHAMFQTSSCSIIFLRNRLLADSEIHITQAAMMMFHHSLILDLKITFMVPNLSGRFLKRCFNQDSLDDSTNQARNVFTSMPFLHEAKCVDMLFAKYVWNCNYFVCRRLIINAKSILITSIQ